MKTLITKPDPIRVGNAVLPELIHHNRSPWHAGFLIIACAFTVVGLLPTARAVDTSLEGDHTSSESRTIYETNWLSNTIQAFTLSGSYLGVFARVPNPTGLVFDNSG